MAPPPSLWVLFLQVGNFANYSDIIVITVIIIDCSYFFFFFLIKSLNFTIALFYSRRKAIIKNKFIYKYIEFIEILIKKSFKFI